MFEWMETHLRITSKTGDLVPFHFNTAQMRLALVVAECWDQGIPVKLLVPKGRQMGISTWVEGFCTALAVLSAASGIAFRAALVAHDDVSAATVFTITRTFLRHLPPEFDFSLIHRNSAEIAWEAGPSIKIYSIKTGDAIAKGNRINFIHYTEAANYADKGLDAHAAYEAIQGSLVKDPNSVMIIESTSKGRDPFFHALVDDCMNGKNDFKLVFLPWFLEPNYRMDWETYRKWVCANPANPDPGVAFSYTEEETVIAARLRHPVPAHQSTYAYQMELLPEQFIWRRAVIRNDFGGREENFARYYPTWIHEAFSATETNAFSPEEVAYYESRSTPPARTGNVFLRGPEPWNATAVWEESALGLVKVWEDPIQGEEYLIAADVGAGRGQDFSAAYVLRCVDLTVVAAVHAQLEWEVYAQLLYALGLYYSTAVLAIENNAHAAVVQWCHQNLYRRLYYYYDEDKLRPGQPNMPGFNMNRKTRVGVIDAITQAVRSRRLTCTDPGFALEMTSFVWNEAMQRYEAAWGKHDDRIIAMAIACYLIRPTQRNGKRSGSPVLLSPAERAREALRAYANMAQPFSRRARSNYL